MRCARSMALFRPSDHVTDRGPDGRRDGYVRRGGASPSRISRFGGNGDGGRGGVAFCGTGRRDVGSELVGLGMDVHMIGEVRDPGRGRESQEPEQPHACPVQKRAACIVVLGVPISSFNYMRPKLLIEEFLFTSGVAGIGIERAPFL